MGLFSWLTKDIKVEEETKNIQDVDFSEFIKITNFLYEKSGIIDLDKRILASSRIKQYAKNKGFYNTNDFLSKLKTDDDFYQDIINIATVNETFFLREVKELKWLVEYIKKEKRPMKILSMPSSSGEEVYSILLMLSDENIDITQVDIVGYDINTQAIASAKEAIYDEHSLHKLDDDLRDKYFRQINNNIYKINPSIQQQTTFYQKNIFDLTNEQNKYDIVLSRNMFIYFDAQKRKEALDIIVNLLKPNGIYIKGHADHIYNHSHLENLSHGIYKKSL